MSGANWVPLSTTTRGPQTELSKATRLTTAEREKAPLLALTTVNEKW
jgi:hypothetical protein